MRSTAEHAPPRWSPWIAIQDAPPDRKALQAEAGTAFFEGGELSWDTSLFLHLPIGTKGKKKGDVKIRQVS